VLGLDGFVLRWERWKEHIYAVTQSHGGTRQWASSDGGRSFDARDELDRPQSLAATDDALWALAGGALLRSSDGEHFAPVLDAVPALRHRGSSLVSAPLVVHRGALWSASPVTGEVLEAVAEQE
jgi:hypothetical protein